MPFPKGYIPHNKGKKTPKEIVRKWVDTRHKNGNYNGYWKGKKRSEETRKKMSEVNKGRQAWNKGIKGSVKPNSGTFAKGITPWNKGRKYPQITGEKNKNWKGGITPINRKIRTSLEYKLWRESVFKRDNYTCIWCEEVGGRLHADHIKPFANFPELRFAIDNGRTLCVVCHKKTDSYLNPYYKPL